jgi:hypothetical protein
MSRGFVGYPHPLLNVPVPFLRGPRKPLLGLKLYFFTNVTNTVKEILAEQGEDRTHFSVLAVFFSVCNGSCEVLQGQEPVVSSLSPLGGVWCICAQHKVCFEQTRERRSSCSLGLSSRPSTQ